MDDKCHHGNRIPPHAWDLPRENPTCHVRKKHPHTRGIYPKRRGLPTDMSSSPHTRGINRLRMSDSDLYGTSAHTCGIYLCRRRCSTWRRASPPRLWDQPGSRWTRRVRLPSAPQLWDQPETWCTSPTCRWSTPPGWDKPLPSIHPGHGTRFAHHRGINRRPLRRLWNIINAPTRVGSTQHSHWLSNIAGDRPTGVG